MYELKYSKSGRYVWYGFSIFFGICSLFAFSSKEYVAASIMMTFAIWGIIYVEYIIASCIAFDLSQPLLIIKKGFSSPRQIPVIDVVALTQSSSYVTLDKLTYKVNGRKRNILVRSKDIDTERAWIKFCDKYLSSARDAKTTGNQTEFINILDKDIKER